MRSLLDDIIDARHGSPVILSEQHDVTQIDAQAALLDERELAKMYTPAQIEAMRNDPTRQKEAKEAAIARASLDTTGGRVRLMVAGQPAWHKLGVNVAEAVTSEHALRLAGLDWQVAKQQLTYRDPVTEQSREATGAFGVIRQDNGAILGTVGSKYKPFQNSDGFAMLDGVLADFGARYEAAGSLYGGERVFMLVRLPEQAFTVGHRDQVEAYALFTNPHDGTGCAECFATSQRVVCANTLRVARNGKKGGIKLRHTGDLKARVKDAQRALGLTVRQFEEFGQNARVLATTPVPSIRGYADGVLDKVLDVTAEQARMGAAALASVIDRTQDDAEAVAAMVERLEKAIEKRGEILTDIIERYESERCGMNGQRGTAWAALNAVTESADHGKLGGRFVGSENDRRSRRFESILTGAADEVKQVAYVQALALAK
jgi:phage/plasmid-like protein (TIGR03299 family)